MSRGCPVRDKHPLCLAYGSVPIVRILAPKSLGLRERARGVCQLHLLQGCRVLLAASLVLWPNMAKLLRKQSFGESVHPDVTFQEPLIPVPHAHSHAPSPGWALSQKSWGEGTESQRPLGQVTSLP